MTQKHHVYMTKDGRISLAGAPPATNPSPPLVRVLYLLVKTCKQLICEHVWLHHSYGVAMSIHARQA